MRTVIPPIRVETMAAKDEGAKTGDSQRKRHRNAGSIEAVARSRSEADWIVGMNATRAATIRLRSSFDGAVSLGRVQTPTLAILARR
ncbi:MAG TPA: DNA topoisomerase, partial [Solirubrobacteraceae bacterium]